MPPSLIDLSLHSRDHPASHAGNPDEIRQISQILRALTTNITTANTPNISTITWLAIGLKYKLQVFITSLRIRVEFVFENRSGAKTLVMS